MFQDSKQRADASASALATESSRCESLKAKCSDAANGDASAALQAEEALLLAEQHLVQISQRSKAAESRLGALVQERRLVEGQALSLQRAQEALAESKALTAERATELSDAQVQFCSF